ncbi:MAG: M48 family metallopeptidase [Candidatus Marinimicrobia bacterium]|nr:M48 family metallopeptidase [Candidatus Neomarinimicrobiota bacterium]
MGIFFLTKPSGSKSWIEEHPEIGKITFARSKRSKTLKLFVKPFHGLLVKLPPGCSTKKALIFAKRNQNWIQQARGRAHEIEKLSRDFFHTHAEVPKPKIRRFLIQRLDSLAHQHDFVYAKVSIRNQKSRWGSCSTHNNISLNQNLYYLPPELLDYVLLHELAHTIRKDHSPAFWTILYNILGRDRTKQTRRDLKYFEFLFHRPPESG